MTFVLNLLSIIAISAGAFFFAAGALGLLRFPDPMTRLHALTKADGLGLGFVVFGLMLQAASFASALKFWQFGHSLNWQVLQAPNCWRAPLGARARVHDDAHSGI